MLHSKVMVVDGRMVVVGSMNLDLRSQLAIRCKPSFLIKRSINLFVRNSIDSAVYSTFLVVGKSVVY